MPLVREEEVAELVEQLGDGDCDVQYSAANELIRLAGGDTEYQDATMEQLHDEDYECRHPKSMPLISVHSLHRQLRHNNRPPQQQRCPHGVLPRLAVGVTPAAVSGRRGRRSAPTRDGCAPDGPRACHHCVARRFGREHEGLQHGLG